MGNCWGKCRTLGDNGRFGVKWDGGNGEWGKWDGEMENGVKWDGEMKNGALEGKEGIVGANAGLQETTGHLG